MCCINCKIFWALFVTKLHFFFLITDTESNYRIKNNFNILYYINYVSYSTHLIQSQIFLNNALAVHEVPNYRLRRMIKSLSVNYTNVVFLKISSAFINSQNISRCTQMHSKTFSAMLSIKLNMNYLRSITTYKIVQINQLLKKFECRC